MFNLFMYFMMSYSKIRSEKDVQENKNPTLEMISFDSNYR